MPNIFKVIRCMSFCFVSYVHFSQLADLNPVRADEDTLQHHRSLFSPLLPQHEPVLDLEQQWQDVLAVLGPQVTTTPFLCFSSYLLFSSCFEFLNAFNIRGEITRKLTVMKQHNINQQV